MKRILGLDPGTNSVGWGVVDIENKKIEGRGVRVIPMDQGVLGEFEAGNSVSQTKVRTDARGVRRLHERALLRRQRLNRTLAIMGFLPEHYAEQLDRYGNILDGKEPKLAWRQGKNGNQEFLFLQSFNEMLEEFRKAQPALLGEGKKIPYDWTIYYLRKKALTSAIDKQELAWLLLQFNQKRGYYQLRGEDEESGKANKVEEYHSLRVVSVEDSGETDRKTGAPWYNVTFENGWVYRRTSRVPLDWAGKVKDLIVTTTLNDDGTVKTDKQGNEKRSFRVPTEDDWKLQKVKTEHSIEQSGKTVGAYIFDTLLQNPAQKLVGGLVRAVERKFYKAELIAILNTQKEFIAELNDRALYQQCIEALYPVNDAYRGSIANKDFVYLLADDILFYQRPLKSKKGLVSNCPYESYTYINKATGKTETVPVKCAAKSSPLFQEFRLWKFLSNLRIYRRTAEVDGKLVTDLPVTEHFLPDTESVAALFDWLNSRSEISQDSLLKYPGFNLKKQELANYRWNYVEDKTYPCNKTRALILAGLKKAGVDPEFLTAERLNEIWHILYSVSDKKELEQAFVTYAQKNSLPEQFAAVFGKIKPFDETDYAAYSAKAIKRLLPLMRMGSHWAADAIDAATQQRIDKIINGEADDSISLRVRQKMASLQSIDQCQGMPDWAACYLVYGRHSEGKDAAKWETPADIDAYLEAFRQHSLRNPIVEQVMLETLRVVRDVWKQYGQIDEIHIEIGRDLKRNAEERKRMSAQNRENENRNLRIKALLAEFLNPEFGVDAVRPQSPSQQELLKIYEEGVLAANPELPIEIAPIFAKLSNPETLFHPEKAPTRSEFLRYKCWLDQKYISPYTGRTIPLAKLFTDKYEIEHIIPQSRYFDDSLSNKVICESEVNKLKDRQLGMEFIKNHQGEIVQLSMGGTVKILSAAEYQQLVEKTFARSRAKMKKLLMDDIPDGFVERQLNDSRYISRLLVSLLSNVVRAKDDNGSYEAESTSKNVVVCNGAVTDLLKRDWGVGDVWNSIILPRFERMNEIASTTAFTALTKTGHTIPNMPLELQRGFSKKRIDHRHHAMDAVVIACCTRDHVNLINNEAALSANRANRYALSRKLRRYAKVVLNGKEVEKAQEFLLPWPSFPRDLYNALQDTVVSFKQNLRVVTRATNLYVSYRDSDGKPLTDANGNPRKGFVKQTQGDSLAIRKSLHKATVFGEVNLKLKKTISLKEALKMPQRIVDPQIKSLVARLQKEGLDAKQILDYFKERNLAAGKIEVYFFTKETNDRYFASRFGNDLVSLLGSADEKKVQGIIDSITDTGIRQILRAHLDDEGGDCKAAFSPDGVDRMNAKIQLLNGGRPHQPIFKVRTYEKAEKFAIGSTGNKSKKFAEADKGTNLFFVVYKTAQKEGRSFATVPLHVVIDCQKQFRGAWRSHLADVLKSGAVALLPADASVLFVLAVNDLVYLPTAQQIASGRIDTIDKDRIYKLVSFNGPQCFCILHRVATPIVNKVEFSSLNKMERAITGEMVKETCLPIAVDRIGNIVRIDTL